MAAAAKQVGNTSKERLIQCLRSHEDLLDGFDVQKLSTVMKEVIPGLTDANVQLMLEAANLSQDEHKDYMAFIDWIFDAQEHSGATDCSSAAGDLDVSASTAAGAAAAPPCARQEPAESAVLPVPAIRAPANGSSDAAAAWAPAARSPEEGAPAGAAPRRAQVAGDVMPAASERDPRVLSRTKSREGLSAVRFIGGSRRSALLRDERRKFQAELKEFLVRHPYLDAAEEALSPDGSASARSPTSPGFAMTFPDAALEVSRSQGFAKVHMHPLTYWVRRCRDSEARGNVRDAQRHLDVARVGIEGAKKRISCVFRHFDLDGSGLLNGSELKYMCAYLGWGAEHFALTDEEIDSGISLDRFEDCVGWVGGLQRLFEKRHRRVVVGRADVCFDSHAQVGANVRSHFLINGKKSSSWKEAKVLAAGLDRCPEKPELLGLKPCPCSAQPLLVEGGNSKTGVLLEFDFELPVDAEIVSWRSRQVVPADWIMSRIEDTHLQDALKEVGVLECQQRFWDLVFPASELRSLERLNKAQRRALAHVRQNAIVSHELALPRLRERFEDLGYGEYELQAVLSWVRELAPIIIHVCIDTVGSHMEIDEYFRNQFETNTSSGVLDLSQRTEWESDLFGEAYEDAKPFDRCKYGVLNVTNDWRGVEPAFCYGDSYLVLKDVRLCCTFAATDSGGISGSRLAVLDKYAHVLQEYTEAELLEIISVATNAIESQHSCLPTCSAPKLLRGRSRDPRVAWITVGYPELAQSSGRYYFEVDLQKCCVSPQVGCLCDQFHLAPGVESAEGVGDDAHGWGVDGQHSARFHNGVVMPWAVRWADGMSVRVGVAVDLDAREIWIATNGVWDSEPAFDRSHIPEGMALYPAISLKGRGSFIFRGEKLQFSPPDRLRAPDGTTATRLFELWPDTEGGILAVDCPRIGDSSKLMIYKEAQIHGPVSFKDNVLRLVANSKYRTKPKTERSWALRVSGAGVNNGRYDRVGAHNKRPLYRAQSGASIFWDATESEWRLSDSEDFSTWRFAAPMAEDGSMEPPRLSWEPAGEHRGEASIENFRRAMARLGVSEVARQAMEAALGGVKEDRAPIVCRRCRSRSFDAEWAKRQGHPSADPGGHCLPATAAWELVVHEVHQEFLHQAGFPLGTVVESEHPYPAKAHEWTKRVHYNDARQLTFCFAPRCGTFDKCARLRVLTGGLQVAAAGEGARVAASAHGEDVKGTLCFRRSDGVWRVRLDRDGLQESQLYRSAIVGSDMNFAPCVLEPEAHRLVSVEYPDGQMVADEIAGFTLTRSDVLCPISVTAFAGKGPARAAGVQPGWVLDLKAIFFGSSRQKLAALQAEGLGVMPHDLDSLYTDLDAVHRRLEAARQLSGVTLFFANGLATKLLPEAHVAYQGGTKVGAEIASFKASAPSSNNGKKETACITVGDFAHANAGPAWAAGVREGWRLMGVQVAGAGGSRQIPLAAFEKSPDSLRSLGNVTLVFSLPDPLPKCVYVGHRAQFPTFLEVPGGSAELAFSTDGDGAAHPELRWGILAFVLPDIEQGDAVKERVLKLATQWEELTTRARGVDSTPSVEREGWDEARLRKLCARHGWEFEWMTEDGERLRRSRERLARQADACLHANLQRPDEGKPDGSRPRQLANTTR